MAEKLTFRQRLSNFATFLWNSETHEFLGRGAKSWGEITLFYIIYYACLAGFFAACFSVFNTMLDDRFPRLQGQDSLIRGNPGMGFKPMPDLDTTFIHYEKLESKSYEPFVKHINDYLDQNHRVPHSNLVNCTTNETRPGAEFGCMVDINKTIEACGPDFGYPAAKPCILLKLNKIFDWIPEPYPAGELPDSMPQSLKDKYDDTMVWISCEGENPGDNDNLGEVEYYPAQGFSMRYFPFQNQDGYLQPLVFARLANIEMNVGMLVECKAWARNIWHDRQNKQGSIHFEIMID